MEFVCEDNGPSKWFFDNGISKFIRKDDVSGKVIGKISPDSLPDPVRLWNARCNHFGVPAGTETTSFFGTRSLSSPQRLKPTPAVFSLWEYAHKDAA